MPSLTLEASLCAFCEEETPTPYRSKCTTCGMQQSFCGACKRCKSCGRKAPMRVGPEAHQETFSQWARRFLGLGD